MASLLLPMRSHNATVWPSTFPATMERERERESRGRGQADCFDWLCRSVPLPRLSVTWDVVGSVSWSWLRCADCDKVIGCHAANLLLFIHSYQFQKHYMIVYIPNPHNRSHKPIVPHCWVLTATYTQLFYLPDVYSLQVPIFVCFCYRYHYVAFLSNIGFAYWH